AIYSNTAQRGGGIHIYTMSSMTLSNVTVSDNRADNGGGIYVFAANTGPVKLVNSILWGNTATSDGNEFANNDYSGLTVVALNNSLYRNRPDETDISISGASVSFEPDAFSLNTSPQFISTNPTQLGYLQLDATSPAIN